MTRTEKLLRDLVALPSVNPAFLPPDHPNAGEGAVQEYLAGVARQAGLAIKFQKVAPGRSNLLARLSPSGAIKRRILLVPHVDTVNADPKSLRPRVLKGRLYGRGACDTKGSIAAMMAAVIEVASQRMRSRETEIVLAFVVDEENAQLGSRVLAASGIKADLAIVGEPTGARVVTAHKGSLWLRIETRGRAAHGALPSLGHNAVHDMARVVDLLEGQYAKSLSRQKHPLLGAATVNVGSIQGGTQPNIVPDHCVIRVDRRTLPGETEASVVKSIGKLIRSIGVQATITGEKSGPTSPLETPSDHPLVRLFLESAQQREPQGVHYFCDASVLAAAGIPSVVFGPGDIAQAHTADEWISLESLELAKNRLVRFLSALP
jgi:acetylornithine deacetylase/succinyl-diaminopimelate desuccinylase family protein